MHDFDLADRYFEKAKQAGAADEVVAIGLANTYLAQGKTKQADAELAHAGRRSFQPTRTTTTCWRRARSTGSATRTRTR